MADRPEASGEPLTRLTLHIAVDTTDLEHAIDCAEHLAQLLDDIEGRRRDAGGMAVREWVGGRSDPQGIRDALDGILSELQDIGSTLNNRP